jgi:hypothetical protein
MVDRELAGRVADLKPMRAAPGAEIFSGYFQARPVVVEFYSHEADPFNLYPWKSFISEIQALDGEIEAGIARRPVLDQFEEWLGLSKDIGRKRSILENLDRIPEGCVTRYPRPIAELQTANCLVYPGPAQGSQELEIGPEVHQAKKRLQLLAESLLEQSLLISLVDAETRLDNFALEGEDALGFRSLPVLAPVPVEWHYELLQYMASSIAGQSPRALHMLSRICSASDPYAGEQHLMRELSGLQPELKIGIVTPQSVAALENYWRTLAKTSMKAPLYLELFHRQWTVIGQYNGEIISAEDVLAESLWPVLARILRLRFSELFSADKGREWAANSGLMLLTAARQVGLLLEQVRDNDLALVLNRQEYESGEAKLNQRTMALVRSTMALAIFLLAIHFSFNAAGGPLKMLAGSAAAISAVVLAVFVTRIE